MLLKMFVNANVLLEMEQKNVVLPLCDRCGNESEDYFRNELGEWVFLCQDHLD
jgi:hypothetical protein